MLRGDDYLNDYKNGGAHDSLTLGVIYAALLAFVVLGCAAVARGAAHPLEVVATSSRLIPGRE